MSEMTLKESAERYSESLKKAASRCRELGKVQVSNTRHWNNIAASLDGLRLKGESAIKAKALTAAQVEASVNAYEKTIKIPH